MMIVENSSKKRSFLSVIDLVLNNRYFLICFFFLILGMLLGALSVDKMNLQIKVALENEFNSFLNFRTESSFLQLFFNCFFNSLIFATLVLISSLGVLGLPAIPFLLFFKGFGTAAFLGLLYKLHGLTGVAFSNLVLIPPYVVCSITLVLLAAVCFELSLKFLLILKDSTAKGILIKPTIVLCFRKYVSCILILTASAFFEALLSSGFMRFFDF